MNRWTALWISSLAMAALLVACKPTEPTSAKTSAKTSVKTSVKTSAKTSPGQNVNVCQKIITEYQAIVKAAAARSNTCRADDDCVCYQGGYGDCGGIIDKVSNKKLLTLMHLARLSKCRYDRACAPRSCIPGCVGGRCVQSARVQR